jgi:protease-4
MPDPTPTPTSAPAPVYITAPPPRQSILARIATSVFASLFVFSLLLNVYLLAFVVASAPGMSETTYRSGDGPRRIVILPIEGMIHDGTADFVREALDQLRRDGDKPAAIILRVDSPGGTVAASDRIWHDLSAFRDETGIPLVASYGSLAASGGYYVSCMADTIFAEPTTITGSIGVIAEAFTFHGLLEKVGVHPETITSTPAIRKDMMNPTRPWTDADREFLRGLLDHSHERFVQKVFEGRQDNKMTLEEAQRLATGEVYTTTRAKELKLIDGEGYLDDAIDDAARLAGLTGKPTVTRMNPRQGVGIVVGLTGVNAPGPGAGAGVGNAELKLDAEALRKEAAELAAPRLEYRVRW